jgi:hypothetical protein
MKENDAMTPEHAINEKTTWILALTLGSAAEAPLSPEQLEGLELKLREAIEALVNECRDYYLSAGLTSANGWHTTCKPIWSGSF